jgi:nicotinamidase-related amidase
LALSDAVLIVIDVQEGFEDARWGVRNNVDCESNIARLTQAWTDAGLPIVVVRHDSSGETSPLRLGTPGNAFKPVLQGVKADLSVSKQVHSAFYGDPDLHAWLQDRGIRAVAVCGITTDHCCETTVRMAGDLGYDTYFVIDATHTFDRIHPDGGTVTADEIVRVSAAKLHEEFATVIPTDEAVALVEAARPASA